LPVIRILDDFLNTETPLEAEQEPEAKQAWEAAVSSKTPSQITKQSGSKREEISQAYTPA
jgi:hypothetical protein